MSEDRRCPICFSKDVYFENGWHFKSPRSGSVVKVRMYRCRACRKSFKEYPK